MDKFLVPRGSVGIVLSATAQANTKKDVRRVQLVSHCVQDSIFAHIKLKRRSRDVDIAIVRVRARVPLRRRVCEPVHERLGACACVRALVCVCTRMCMTADGEREGANSRAPVVIEAVVEMEP